MDEPPKIIQEDQAKELEILRHIQSILKTPDKINKIAVDALEEIIKEKTLLALNYSDHVSTKITPEKSPLEIFADAQAEEIKQLRAGESEIIKQLRERIKSLEDEINVINSFFRAYNGE